MNVPSNWEEFHIKTASIDKLDKKDLGGSTYRQQSKMIQNTSSLKSSLSKPMKSMITETSFQQKS